jgi:son of sevenless-like protein
MSAGIPYLGVYLTDLTFIEDGNKDFINDSLINFDKRRKIAQVIMEIQQYQATPYCLEEVPALRDFLLNLETFDENEAYSHSLQVTQPVWTVDTL